MRFRAVFLEDYGPMSFGWGGCCKREFYLVEGICTGIEGLVIFIGLSFFSLRAYGVILKAEYLLFMFRLIGGTEIGC